MNIGVCSGAGGAEGKSVRAIGRCCIRCHDTSELHLSTSSVHILREHETSSPGHRGASGQLARNQINIIKCTAGFGNGGPVLSRDASSFENWERE